MTGCACQTGKACLPRSEQSELWRRSEREFKVDLLLRNAVSRQKMRRALAGDTFIKSHPGSYPLYLQITTGNCIGSLSCRGRTGGPASAPSNDGGYIPNWYQEIILSGYRSLYSNEAIIPNYVIFCYFFAPYRITLSFFLPYFLLSTRLGNYPPDEYLIAPDLVEILLNWQA